MKVLFVCLGNICRSPAAEGVFIDYVTSQGVSHRVEVDSAGTASWHTGKRADPRMRSAASDRGVQLTSRARQVRAEDFEVFDLIVAMDHSNYRDLEALQVPGGAALRMLGDFLPEVSDQDAAPDVPDPYYGGPDGFELVLDMLERACEPIARHLKLLSPE